MDHGALHQAFGLRTLPWFSMKQNGTKGNKRESSTCLQKGLTVGTKKVVNVSRNQCAALQNGFCFPLNGILTLQGMLRMLVKRGAHDDSGYGYIWRREGHPSRCPHDTTSKEDGAGVLACFPECFILLRIRPFEIPNPETRNPRTATKRNQMSGSEEDQSHTCWVGVTTSALVIQTTPLRNRQGGRRSDAGSPPPGRTPRVHTCPGNPPDPLLKPQAA